MLAKTIRVILFSCVAVVCLNSTPCAGLRILGIFPLQMRSHYVICGELMRGLAKKGHQVDVYSHFPLDEKIPNYRDFSLHGSIPAFINNLTFDTTRLPSIPAMLEHWIVHEGKRVCDLLSHPHLQKLLQEPPKDPAYDVVVIEISIINCFIPLGRYLNVPVVGVTPVSLLDWSDESFGYSINPATDPVLLSPYTAPMSFFERLDNAMIYYTVKRSYNQYIREQDKYITEHFGPDYPNAAEIFKDISLLLINHNAALHGQRLFAPGIKPVGGLHVMDDNKTLPKVVQNWLDESKQGCIYFTFGSMTRFETFPKHMIEAFYKSFANISPVRVLLKVAKPEELPPGLPPNVMTQSWFDQIPVLKHRNVKCFITHGGLMSTQESIYYEVPMIGIPLFADQPNNVAACVKRRIAIKIDVQDISEKSVTDALRKILTDSSYKEAVQRVSQEFKDNLKTPLDTAIFWTEYIARHGKDALKSPAIYLPWWQASLFDVYTFVIVIIISVLCILYVLITKIHRMLWVRKNSNSFAQEKKSS